VTPGGTFTEHDLSDVADLLDQKVLKGGLGRLFRKFDGVGVRPASTGAPPRSMRAATAAGIPQASISKSGLFSAATVKLWPPADMSEDDAMQLVSDAGVGPEPRKSFGQYIYDFPGDVAGGELVKFATAALRALGARPANDRWEWWASEPEPD
jgi:hypothetical protein